MKVLLVDDSDDARFLLRERLAKRRPFEVVGEAASGEEALKEIERLEPDLVIMDVRMPGMDGVETTRLIKQRFPDTSVVALSSYADAGLIVGMRKAGAVGYVLKDASDDELIMRLHDAERAETG